MAFNLRKLLQDAGNDISGAGRAVASTAQRNIVNPVSHAIGNTVNAGATAARDTYGAAKATGRFIAATPTQNQVQTQQGPMGAINRALASPGLGVKRSIIGTAQGASGLYDLATPGKGTNRFDKVLQQHALAADAAGKASNHPNLYKPGQALGDAASFALGGAVGDVAKIGLKANPVIGKVVGLGDKAGTILSKPVLNLADNVASKGLGGRVAAAGFRGLVDSKNVAGNAAMTALQTGANASKGRDTNISEIAKSLGEGTAFSGLLPAGGQLTKEAIQPAIKTATKALQDAHLARPSNLNDSEVAHLGNFMNARGTNAMTQDVYNNGVAAAQKAGVDLNNPQAVDNLLGAHVTHATVVQQRMQALQDLKDKAVQFGREHQPGLSQKAVDENGNPVSILSGKPIKNGDVQPTKLVPQAATKPELLQTQLVPKASEEGSVALPQDTPKEVTITHTNPVTGRQMQVNESDLINEHERLSSIPLNERTVQQATALSDVKKGLKLLRAKQDTPKVVPNALSAKTNKQNLSLETVSQVSGDHIVRNTKQLADTSAASVDKLPTNTAIENAHEMIAQPLGHVSDEQTGFITKTIEKADTEAAKARAAGNVTEADRLTREAAALHDGLSEHATARGQANQALTMLYKQSPQGMLYGALRDLKKAGIKDTPELRAKLQPLVDAVKTAKNQAEKTDAIAKFHQAVSKTMPQHLSDKAIGIWKAGLLSGVKTQQGNAISNGTFAVMKKISDVPAAAVDKLMSIFTGKRTKTLSNKGIGSGTVEGGKNAIFTMKTGLDRRSVGDKYEQHAEIDFKNPLLNKTLGTAVRTVFRGMSAADQPFWYSAFKNSMYDQAKAAAANAKVPLGERKAFMENLVKNPTDKMANTALSEANKATLNYDTLASKAVQAVHTGIDKVQSLNGRPVPGAARAAAHAAVNILAPFVRVPTAFLSRTIDFTPLGIGKEAFHQILTKKFDQRALSQAIGEGLTGTGAIALGIALTQKKMLSGDYPKSDAKEQQRWKTEHITPNSVKLGDTWVSLNYLGPLGLLFNTGNKIESAKGQGVSQQTSQALVGFGTGLMGQSFLQGFSGFSDAINDPARNAKSFVNSQASSIVPSIVNDAANVSDSFQRQADTVTQAIKNRIPGLREQNLVKQDVYGNPLKQAGGRLGTVVGYKPSMSGTNTSPAIAEVSRLHSVDPNNSDLQVTPTPVGKSITVEKTTVPLNDKQRYGLQNKVGQETQAKWNDLIKTPEYKAMDDTQKAAALTNIKTLATQDATRSYVVANNLATYNKPADAKVIALNQGTNTIADLASSKATGGSTGVVTAPSLDKSSKQILTQYNALSSADRTKKAYGQSNYDYQVAAAKYANNKAKGTLSTTQNIKAQDNLAKLKAGSTTDKETRDLYGLSSADLYNYVSTNPDGKAIAAKVIAYGDALVNAGVEAKNKFKSIKGAVTLGKSSTKSTSAAKSGKIDYAKQLTVSNASSKALRALVQKNYFHFKKPKLKVA